VARPQKDKVVGPVLIDPPGSEISQARIRKRRPGSKAPVTPTASSNDCELLRDQGDHCPAALAGAQESASPIMLSFSQHETFAHLIYWYVAVEPETAAVY